MMEWVCKSYASALYSLLAPEERDAYKQALTLVAGDFKADALLFKVLCSYSIKQEEKEAMLQNGYARLGLRHLVPFLSLLCQKHRISLYFEIENQFVQLVEEGQNVKSGIVYSAERLTDAQLASIEASMRKKTSFEVRLSNLVDPSLLGGVKVALDGKVYDGSLRGRLQNLAKKLQGGNQ